MIDFASSKYIAHLAPQPEVILDDSSGNEPRLNVLLPHLSKSFAFGGVVSALELGRSLSRHYGTVRFLSQHPLEETPDPFDFTEYVDKRARIETGNLYDPGGLSCHTGDIFFCPYWVTVLAWEAHAGAMRAKGLEPNPFYYFIQDFEPGFYPFGYKYDRCLSTYGHFDHACVIFNTRSLAQYFHDQGHRFSRQFVLAPPLHSLLHDRLRQLRFTLPPKLEHPLTILLYGRPSIARNAFPAILDGLHRYFGQVPKEQRGDYAILSLGAGQPHEDIELHPGAVVRSMGKLSMEKYAALLMGSHVGVGLMASPHPSYPPLEMAAFGLHTITNRFANKDLSEAHPRIRSIDQPWPENLARELGRCVEAVQAEKGVSLTAEIPDCLGASTWASECRRLRLPGLAPSNAT